MRVVLKLLFVNMVIILIFSAIYINIGKSHFIKPDGSHPKYIDCLLESITIQAGVGMSTIIPNTILAKIVVMIQQLLLICTSAITLYIFIKL